MADCRDGRDKERGDEGRKVAKNHPRFTKEETGIYCTKVAL